MVLLVGFVLAVITAPTALTFEDNTTASYDKEGVFTINWTAGGSDEVNYTVYIYADDILYTSVVNDSATGRSFSNTTDANYTFTIEAVNSTGNKLNSTNISMIVDTTTPALIYSSIGTESNAASKSQSWIFVNVTSSDTNNDTLVFNLYYSNGTLVNSTSYSSYSPTQINWTSLAEAGYIYNVTANDSATNSNSTSSRTITLDTTDPTVTLSKSSLTSYSLTIIISGGGTCTVNRDGASISGSTLKEPGLSCGTSYSYVVTCTDSAGNSGSSSSTSFSTEGCSGGETPSAPEWEEKKISFILKNNSRCCFNSKKL